MRLAPVALHGLGDPDEVARIAAAECRTTHAAPQAVEAFIWFAELLRRAILGEPRDSLLQPKAYRGHAARRAAVAGNWRSWPRNLVRSFGYVIHTLEAALWSVDQTNSFEDAYPPGERRLPRLTGVVDLNGDFTCALRS